MTLTLEIPESVADRLKLLPAGEVNTFAVAAIAERLSLPPDEEVSLVRESLEQVKEGKIRPASLFFQEHRERFPEPQDK